MNLTKLDTIGEVTVAADKLTHDIVLLASTGVGTIQIALTKEQSLHLGISLIRQSGKRLIHEQPPASEQVKENSNEKPGNGRSDLAVVDAIEPLSLGGT